MDCPHEHEVAILSEALLRQDVILAVMCWRLGGQVRITCDEISHVQKVYELEKQARVTPKEADYAFSLKAR
jgi:hypothetical protein